MSKKETVPVDEAAKLEDAVTRAQREIELFKNWLANDGRHSPSVGKPRRTSSQTAPQLAATHTGTQSFGSANNESTRLLQRNLSQLKWGGLIAVVVILFAAFAVVVSGYRNTQAILQQIALHDLQITEPADGASLVDGQTIRGNTPYPGLNHYFVLTDAKTGHVSIQPARAISGGSFAGEMTLNSEGAGAAKQPDEIFLRVLATQEQLGTGPLVTYPDDGKFSRQVRLWSKPVEQLVISNPAEGATVGLDEPVVGNTRLGHLKHYVVVTPIRSGTPFIQAQPVNINDGSFTGHAQFATQSHGSGERFAVEIMATSATLSAGALTSRPADAVTSKPVTVRRR